MTFTGWTPSLTDDKVTINGNTTVTANFTQDEYTLTIVSAHGTVTKDPEQATYHYGDKVTLSMAADRWTFTDWTPALTDNKVTISGNTTVTANFTQDEYTLTIVSAHGTVTKDPEQATYHYGDEVTLSMAADPGLDLHGLDASPDGQQSHHQRQHGRHRQLLAERVHVGRDLCPWYRHEVTRSGYLSLWR